MSVLALYKPSSDMCRCSSWIGPTRKKVTVLTFSLFGVFRFKLKQRQNREMARTQKRRILHSFTSFFIFNCLFSMQDLYISFVRVQIHTERTLNASRLPVLTFVQLDKKHKGLSGQIHFLPFSPQLSTG